MMKELNKFFKDNLKEVQIAFAILTVLYLLSGNSVTLGREGLLGLGSIAFSIGLTLVGYILIIIPEPATTLTGFVMVIVGFFLGGGSIYSLIKDNLWIVLVIIGVSIFLKMGSLRSSSAPRARTRVIYVNGRRPPSGPRNY